jgi:glycerol-3-phosphate dehydrogenase (NAD(P)+)
MTRRFDLSVFGAGAWGTALAMTWARQGAKVALWGHPEALVSTLALERRHPSLPGAELPPSVRPLADPAAACNAPIWVSALPTQVNPAVWADLAGRTALRPELLIHVSKGIIQGSHLRITQVLEPLLGVPVGVLSGPTFADEVSRWPCRRPWATTGPGSCRPCWPAPACAST